MMLRKWDRHLIANRLPVMQPNGSQFSRLSP